MDPYAKHRFLRTTLGFKYTWWYYLAIFIDPIIRFNWIFYAIYGQEAQHSSLVSFFVAFTEVLRRGMWTLFRVENEHCTKYIFRTQFHRLFADKSIVLDAFVLRAIYRYRMTCLLHLTAARLP